MAMVLAFLVEKYSHGADRGRSPNRFPLEHDALLQTELASHLGFLPNNNQKAKSGYIDTMPRMPSASPQPRSRMLSACIQEEAVSIQQVRKRSKMRAVRVT